MASISIGYGKTYDWSKGAVSNLTQVATSTAGGSNGWLILAEIAASTTKTWTSLTDFSEDSSGGTFGDSAIISNALNQFASDDNTPTTSYTQVYSSAAWGANSTSFTLSNFMQFVTMGTLTSTATSHGFIWLYGDGTRRHYHCFILDSGVLKIKSYNGSDFTVATTTWVPDTNFHLIQIRNANSANADELLIDGTVYATGLKTFNSASREFDSYAMWRDGDVAKIEHNVVLSRDVNSATSFQTSDGTWTSTYDDAIFDAGAGRQWATVDFSKVTADSTAVTVEVRCASTSGGLSTASYETIATSGNSIVTKNRFIQIRLTLADASSGQYTPIMQDITVTDEVAPVGGNHIQYSFFHLW